MMVKKGKVKLISKSVNDVYDIEQTYEAEVFEKTDGNYKEVISKKIDKVLILRDIKTGEIVNETHTGNDFDFKIYPGVSLEEFYNSLDLPGYTVIYIEPLVTI